MESKRIRRLAVAATLANSYLAVIGLDRALIAMPAWQRAGPLAWAGFSRHADNGHLALILYPALAFTGLVLTALAAFSFHRNGRVPRQAAIPIYAAAGLTIAGLITTIGAAPNMLSVPHLGNDPAALQQALDGFQFWGDTRAVFQLGAFLAGMWSVTALSTTTRPRPASGPEPGTS